MIERNIYTKLKNSLKKREIMALIGSRQVGKTTLMKMLFDSISGEKKQFLSFENQKILTLFETNLDEFIKLYVDEIDYLFIDEIQYSKSSGQKLKYLYDEFKIKIIVSGSSATDLSINSLSYLVGRVLVYEIFTLTFEEFLNYKDKNLLKIYQNGVVLETLDFINSLFEEFVTFGSYPRVILENSDKEKEEILANLVNSYLLKEIREILSFDNSYEYEKLLEILSIKNGGILNKSSVSSDTGINLNKVESMISILEKTFILNLLRPIDKKQVKELIKSPKIYFLDIGFRNSIIESFQKINLRVDKGYIYETFIYSELVKAGIKPKFYNYKNSSEVDFILEKNGKTVAIEVKSSINNLNLDKSYRNFIEKYKPDYFYVLNEKFFESFEYEGTNVVFTHFINIKQIIELVDRAS